jgi:hypothetical protein
MTKTPPTGALKFASNRAKVVAIAVLTADSFKIYQTLSLLMVAIAM